MAGKTRQPSPVRGQKLEEVDKMNLQRSSSFDSSIYAPQVRIMNTLWAAGNMNVVSDLELRAVCGAAS